MQHGAPDFLEGDGRPERRGGAPGIDLSALLRAARKRWPLGLLVAALVVACTFVWTYRQPKVYESSAHLIIELNPPAVLNEVKDVVPLGSDSYWVSREFQETQYRIITSKEIARRVVDKLGLKHDPDYVAPGQPVSLDDLAAAVAGQVRVAAVKESRVARVTVSDSKPDRAAMIANAVSDAYIDYNLDYKLQGAQAAANLLGDRESDLSGKVNDAERRLFEFKEKNKLLDVSFENKQSMTSANLMDLNQRLVAIRARRIELEARRKQIAAARRSIEAAETVPDVRDNDVVKDLRRSYLALRREFALLDPRYGENHPKYKYLQEQLDAVRADYEREIDNTLKAFDRTFETVTTTEAGFVEQLEQEKKKASELARLEIDYKPLKLEAERQTQLHSTVSRREGEAMLTGQMRVNNVRVLERAMPVLAPVKPRMVFNLGLGALAGLLLGLATLVVMELFDNTIKTQEDAEQTVGAPVLGIIPLYGPREKGSAAALRERDLGVFADPKSVAAECCRSIRTNLLFMSPDKPLRTIVVTSPGPEEGKTTTAISLAITMAQAGGRTLLIDTDMRRPRLHKSFGVANETGVSTVILGETPLRDAVRSSGVPNLDILPCGPSPPNPAELLHAERFSALLTEALESYERVILDSPPTSAVTDAAVLGHRADGVVLVVRGGNTTREAAVHARRQLAGAKGRVLGVVINRIDFRSRYYGAHYYRYYRSYTYGNETKA